MNAYHAPVAATAGAPILNPASRTVGRFSLAHLVAVVVGLAILAAAVVVGLAVETHGTPTPTAPAPAQVSVYRAPAAGVFGIY